MLKNVLQIVLEKLTSRKLWIAVAGIVYFALQGQNDKVIDIAKTYLIVDSGVNIFGGTFQKK